MDKYLLQKDVARLENTLKSDKKVVICFYGTGNNGKTTMSRMLEHKGRVEIAYGYSHVNGIMKDIIRSPKFIIETNDKNCVDSIEDEAKYIKYDFELFCCPYFFTPNKNYLVQKRK